jgi:hypothetical protein
MDAQGGESAGVEDGFAAVVVGVLDGGSGKQVKGAESDGYSSSSSVFSWTEATSRTR